MVLAIDIGNTTIKFTGLKEMTGTSAFREEAHVGDMISDGIPAELKSADPVSGDNPGKAADGVTTGQDISFAHNPAADFEIVFTEKILTETGKNLPLFLEEAGNVLAKHGIIIGQKEGESACPQPVDSQDEEVNAVALSSVVPACTPAAELLAEKLSGKSPVLINWHRNTGLSFKNIPDPDKVGADRIADSAWAASRYPLPAMTVDMGTATTINVVSAKKEFLGGMIGSGVRTSLHSLRTGTAQLPELLPGPVPPEKLIGTDTAGCMLSAAIVGTAAMIDGLASHVEEQIGSSLTLILTGGNAPAVSEWIRHSYIYEPGLAAKGSALIALREQLPDS